MKSQIPYIISMSMSHCYNFLLKIKDNKIRVSGYQ